MISFTCHLDGSRYTEPWRFEVETAGGLKSTRRSNSLYSKMENQHSYPGLAHQLCIIRRHAIKSYWMPSIAFDIRAQKKKKKHF